LLHVGAARVAIANNLFARKHGDGMVLRLDDADPNRCKPEAAQAIEADLGWLGLGSDRVVRQSERLHLYRDAAARLEKSGRLYPCFESEEELRAKHDRRVRRHQPPVYDRAMLRLTAAQRAAAEAGGKRPYWRFRLSDETVRWHDLVLGPRTVKLPAVSDPVAIRSDGVMPPIFTSAVDDLDLDITHVIRGEDHVESAGPQLDMRAALGGDPAGLAFAHLPSLLDEHGGRLSRRTGNLSVRSLRQNGIEASAVLDYLARLGSSDDPAPLPIDALAAAFDLSHVSRSPARFDIRQLLALNRKVLHALPYPAVADRLPGGATEAFWYAVRGNIDMLSEARGWWEVVAGTIVSPVVEGEEAFLHAALDVLPHEPWDDTVWTAWTGALQAETGRSGRALYEPLRLALTGEEDGPELGALLPLMGRSRAAARLSLAAQ
jgi:glutamyl-tRNA synthetase